MFTGQERIYNELNIISRSLVENPNQGSNLLFRAPSGYGKTILSFIFCNSFDRGRYEYLLPDNNGNITIDVNKRTHILDEIHTCRNQEYLYPFMDTGNMVFVLTTNETGTLNEALQNRCINLIFEEYTDEELKRIVGNILSPYITNGDLYVPLIDYSRCPRILVKLCQRLVFFFKNYAIPTTVEEVRRMLDVTVNIRDNMNEEQRRYVNFLTRVNNASIDAISSSIGIDKATIKRDIEPALLYKNRIRITSRGRIINDD
jgi:Holliday junction resolvasome RuvABC ATP-dependent DNA helicase subunit